VYVLVWNLERETLREDCMLKKFNCHKSNCEKIISDFRDIDWDQEFNGRRAEEMWKLFLRSILASRDRHILMKERREKSDKVRIKSKIRKMISKSNKK